MSQQKEVCAIKLAYTELWQVCLGYFKHLFKIDLK